MKFSELWLREWVSPDLTTKELAHVLTMAGLEVDSITPVAGDFDHVVIGEVKTVKPHPNADNLRLCEVDIGKAERLSIVCGATNVRVGLKVPVALVGATLPGDIKIKHAKLRGIESAGMLCSAKELGMAETSDGLLELDANAPIGKDIREYLWLDDNTIELGLTPNRGDCLSIAGIAREAGALCKVKVTPDDATTTEAVTQKQVSVDIRVSVDCPRYVCQVIEDINPAADTPQWIKEALRRCGLRSLSSVVDITNFVMLELGQPMHAFDLDQLSGGIVVRHARQGEPLELLNGQTIILDDGTMIIADHDRPVALAGIMGGQSTAVCDQTQHVLLESAFFHPQAIAGKARRYGLHTDSSHRFERGVDPELQRKAVARATSLLLGIVGGKPGPVVEVIYDDKLPVRQSITLRPERIQRILGSEIPGDEVEEILCRLGMKLLTTRNSWNVTPPSYRFDIEIEEDLIEEVARVYGYDWLPVTLPQSGSKILPKTESRIGLSRLRSILVARGYQEVITYSFVDPKLQAILAPDDTAIPLANPISADMSVMRTSHWPGLIQTMLYNRNRQQKSMKFFESGLKFLRQGTDIKQEGYLSGVVTGDTLPEQWGSKARPVDFFDAKNDIEALLDTVSDIEQVRFVPCRHPVLHPGQSADILNGQGLRIGCIGALHPAVEADLGLDQQTFVYELALSCFDNAHVPRHQPVSKFPSIRRDIAIVVDEDVSIEAIKNVMKKASSGLLNNFQLFDVYQGKGIDSGRKSVAFGLTFQDHARTLVDSDVEAAKAQLISALIEHFGATLRE